MLNHERLKKIRKENKMTQKKLAEVLCVDRTSIVKYEKGEAQPSPKVLAKLSECFGVSSDYLLGLTNDIEISSERKERSPKEENVLEIARIIAEQDFVPSDGHLSDEQKELISDYIRGNSSILKKLLNQTK